VEFKERKRRNDVKMDDSGAGELSGRELSRRENRVKEEKAEQKKERKSERERVGETKRARAYTDYLEGPSRHFNST